MAAETNIELPNKWTPRKHQLRAWQHLQNGGTRAVAVWHRRAGKDSTALNFTAAAAHQRIGTYWHMLPEAAQARKAVWMGIDKEQRRIIDQVFPVDLRKRTLDNEMLIELKIGSVWQVVGSDNYDSLVGANVVGVVFSEFSLSNPAAWDYLRPILAENGGWAIFLFTPRGKNHGWKLYNIAKKLMEAGNKDWFAEVLTVNDTMVIAPSVIQAERDSGMDDDMVQQEYFCSWEGVQQGSIYGTQLAAMRADGRIAKVPYDRRYPVNTFWDIGHSDATSIILHQTVGAQDRFLRCYESGGQDMGHYVQKLAEFSSTYGYLYGDNYFPHDAKNVTLAAKSNPLGKNVWDQALALGMRNLKLVPRINDRWTGINQTRAKMSTAMIDAEGCEPLINALDSYHKQWDDKRKCYNDEPYHDWSSNYADAFRMWGQANTQAGGQASTFSMPGPLPTKLAMQGRAVSTIGQKSVGY